MRSIALLRREHALMDKVAACFDRAADSVRRGDRVDVELFLKALDFINELSDLCRSKGLPVVWTHVGYMDSGEDAGVWGTRTDTPDSLQNIKVDSERFEFDDRLKIDHKRDAIYNKLMPSAFHETSLQSLCIWHQVDTIILTGGSTSGCVRATCVDSLSRGYRTIVTEECVADKHEIPHFSNLCDMQVWLCLLIEI